jgi:hypothetical protein
MGRQIGGSPTTINMQGTITTLTSQSGRQPGQPLISSPFDNSTLANFTPTLSSSAFFAYSSDTHMGSNWQIASDSNFINVLKDFATKSSLTSWAVNSDYTIPRLAQTLYFRVRYVSSANEVSPWSAYSRMVVARTLSTIASFNSTSGFNFSITYSGTGTPTSFTVKVANNAGMTSPIVNTSVSVSANIGSFTVPYTSMPGFTDGSTPYYIQITPAGSDAITATEVQALVSPLATVTGVSATTTYDTGSTVTMTLPSTTLSTGTAPQLRYQFSTVSNFSSITYEGDPNTALTFAASNLAGLSGRTQKYYFRPVLAIGSDRVPMSSLFTPIYVQAVKLISPTNVNPNTANTGTSSIPSGYAGPITVVAIGGGGGGGMTGYDAGSGGGGGYLNTGAFTVSGGESISYTLGTAGAGAGWVYAQTAAECGGTTTISVGSLGSVTAAGGLAGTNNSQPGATAYQSGYYTDVNGNTSYRGGAGGSSGGDSGINSPGNLYVGKYTTSPTAYHGRGGRNATSATGGGTGGQGWGAGGGGSKRDQAAGGGSDSYAGGGGNGIFWGNKAADGYYTNVGNGGNGMPGAAAIYFINW